jgi:hypothetical protein
MLIQPVRPRQQDPADGAEIGRHDEGASTTAQVKPFPGMSVRETAQAIGTAMTVEMAADISPSSSELRSASR